MGEVSGPRGSAMALGRVLGLMLVLSEPETYFLPNWQEVLKPILTPSLVWLAYQGQGGLPSRWPSVRAVLSAASNA